MSVSICCYNQQFHNYTITIYIYIYIYIYYNSLFVSPTATQYTPDQPYSYINRSLNKYTQHIHYRYIYIYIYIYIHIHMLTPIFIADFTCSHKHTPITRQIVNSDKILLYFIVKRQYFNILIIS